MVVYYQVGFKKDTHQQDYFANIRQVVQTYLNEPNALNGEALYAAFVVDLNTTTKVKIGDRKVPVNMTNRKNSEAISLDHTFADESIIVFLQSTLEEEETTQASKKKLVAKIKYNCCMTLLCEIIVEINALYRN